VAGEEKMTVMTEHQDQW